MKYFYRALAIKYIYSGPRSGCLCALNPVVHLKSAVNRYLHSKAEDVCTYEEDFKEKVIYNTFINKTKFLDKKRAEKAEKKFMRKLNETLKPTSVSLKYLKPQEPTELISKNNSENHSEYKVNLPYSVKTLGCKIFKDEEEVPIIKEDFEVIEKNQVGERISDLPTHAVGKWLNDYEKYAEEEDEDESNFGEWRKDYGTPDPKAPVSQVPCGGCGALLHCQDHSIPGYLPSEIFKNCSKNDLRETICQRCHFLKNYNTALSVTVDPEIYPKLISKIKNERALIILLADVTDLPCSLWPGILDIIETNGDSLQIVGSGSAHLDTGNSLLVLENVLLVPELKLNLLTENRLEIAFGHEKATFTLNGLKKMTAWLSNGLYILNCSPASNMTENYPVLANLRRTHPLFLVGNKIDLLWGDRRGWLNQTLSFLRSFLPSGAPVQHVSLISAKTGFGVEELITKLHNIWQYKGDVYLIGCANVGKSTLFNALLQSDYCKVKAVDLIQRATTAPWPGTTINLLKFPILRPEGWRLHLRTLRLKEEQKRRAAEIKLKKEQRNHSEKKIVPQLVGHIGRSFSGTMPKEEIEAKDNFTIANISPSRFGLNPNDPDFAASKWVYDTPGVLHQEQILEFLTTEEIVKTVPNSIIEPRTYSMKVGWTMFVAGLARIDYLKGNKNIRITVFSSSALPVTITQLESADELYTRLLGTEYFSVPQGPEERLNEWPGLECSKEVPLIGVHREESCSDVTLSSAGWVSITPEAEEIIKMRFWTPKGRGVHVRTPPLLPKAVALRGKKENKSPAYFRSRPFVN